MTCGDPTEAEMMCVSSIRRCAFYAQQLKFSVDLNRVVIVILAVQVR